MEAIVDSKVLDIGMIENLKPGIEKHVSEDLYNAGLNFTKQQKLKGIVSGKILNSPEQTYKIWEKFNKTLLRNTGKHRFNYGDYVHKTGESYSVDNGPIYLLNKATRDVPIKNKFVFHPSVVDNNGKFHLLDDNDMYKVLIPTIYGLSGIKE